MNEVFDDIPARFHPQSTSYNFVTPLSRKNYRKWESTISQCF